MNINLKKREVSLKEIICLKYGQTKAECDLIVPDAKPDVAKILQVCAHPVITQKTSQQDKAYIQGVIHLTVIYIPDGGGMKSIFSTLDFSYVTDAAGAEPDSHIWAEVCLEEIDYQIVNSRKINIKCCLGIDIKISRRSVANLPTGLEEDCNIQTQYKNYKISSTSPEEEQNFRFREKIEVPSGKPDICEIIKINARAVSNDLRYSDGKLNISGDIALSVLYTDENTALSGMEETLPFNETLEGITLPEGNIEGCFNVCDIVFDIEEAPDGSRRFLNIDLLICGSFKTSENIELSAISDAFGIENPLKLSKNSYETESVINKNITQITHKEAVSIPDYLPEIYRLCDVSGEARVTGISMDEGKVNIDGEIFSNIIYMSANEGEPLSGMSHISSFSKSVDMPQASKTSICEAKIELDHIGYNINSEREAELRFIIILTVSILKSDTLEVIEEIIEDTDCEKKLISPAVIYYPEEGETVWDIAKHYAVAPETIISGNNLEGDTLRKGQKICIFR